MTTILQRFDETKLGPLNHEELERLRAHPLFGALPNKRQCFVVSFIENGGRAMRAVKTHYNCKDDRSADQIARTLLRDWKIRRILSWWGVYSLDGILVGRSEAIQLLSDRMRDPETDAKTFLSMLDRLETLIGWDQARPLVKDEEVSLTPKDAKAINERVLELERQRKEKPTE